MSTLLLFSGGIDSTLCLYRHLLTGSQIRVHHVRLRSPEGRFPLETRAAHAVLHYLQRNPDFRSRIHFTESAFDYGDLTHQVRDHIIWGLTIGMILADPANKRIRKLILPRHRDSFRRTDARGMQYSNASYSALPLHVARRQPKILYPLIDMTKRDIIKELPIELLRLCWWCRRPRDGAECHRCHTCRQVDPVLREIGFSRKEGADAHVSV